MVEFCAHKIAELGSVADFPRHIDSDRENLPQPAGLIMPSKSVANRACGQIIINLAISAAAVCQHMVGDPALAEQAPANMASACRFGANNLPLSGRQSLARDSVCWHGMMPSCRSDKSTGASLAARRPNCNFFALPRCQMRPRVTRLARLLDRAGRRGRGRCEITSRCARRGWCRRPSRAL